MDGNNTHEAKLYFHRLEPFSTTESIVSIFENIIETKVSYVPPVKPKGGEVYIYSHGGDQNKKDDWKSDQHRWHYNTRNPLPRKDPVFFKYFFNIMTEDGPSKDFCKHVFIPTDDNAYVLLHYLGNAELSKDFAHGNSKLHSKTFHRTAPSVVRKIKENNHQEPSIVYKRLQTQSSIPSALEAVMKPRNMKQVRNGHLIEKQKQRISRDDLYNLHEIAYHLNEYIWKIETFPDLTIIFGLNHIMEEFKRVIEVPLENTSIRQHFSYDTTFEVGDFFLTPFIFRHVLFEGSPLMSLAFMIHERRHHDFHSTFIKLMKDKCPALSKIKVPILLDRERAMTNAFKACLPNMDILYCWNHLRRDIRLWLRRHNATSAEIPFYVDGIVQMMSSGSLEEFESMKENITESWSESMLTYFNQHLEKDIKEHAARFVIEKHGLYNPFSGVTNNIAESENAVIKRLVDWKEVTLDAVVLSLHMEQQYLYNEALRGRCALGEYKLRDIFSGARLTPDEVTFTPIACNPEDIVDFINGYKEHTVNNEDGEFETNVENIPPPVQEITNCMSQTAMAMATGKSGKVVHIPQLKAFVVEGITGEKYAVSLFPREKCQCPSNSICYHILAARLSVNIPIEDKKKSCNLTVLRKNARCRAEKKLGRKHQNIDNKTFTPAPDSKAVKRTQSTEKKGYIKEACVDDFECAFSPILEETNSPAECPKIEKKFRKSLDFNKQQLVKENASDKSGKTELTTDEKVTLYQMLKAKNLNIPQDEDDYLTQAMSDPVLSLFREAFLAFGDAVDDYSNDLISITPKEDDIVGRSSALQLTSAVILTSEASNISPFQMTQTLLLKPDHLTRCSLSRSAPNHNLRVLNNDVGRVDLKSLEGQNWLNDKIIHAYLGILMREKNDKEPNQVFVLPSYLALKWIKDDYESCWTFPKVNLLGFKHILLPVLVSNHWILLHITTEDKNIAVYDSLQGKQHSLYLGHWIKFLEKRSAITSEKIDGSWSLFDGKSNLQKDGHSCGVFVLMNAESVVNGVPPVIMRQVHCAEFRQYIRRRIVSIGKKNDEVICEMPFCKEPAKKYNSTLQCDHCHRWVHKLFHDNGISILYSTIAIVVFNIILSGSSVLFHKYWPQSDLNDDVSVRVKDTGLKENGLKEIGLKEIGLKEHGLKEIGLKEIELKEIRLKEIEFKETGLKEIGLKEIGLKEHKESVKTTNVDGSNISLRDSVCCPLFYTLAFWYCIPFLVYILYIGIINKRLEDSFPDDVSYYTNILAYINLGGFVSAFLPGFTNEWQIYLFKDKKDEKEKHLMPLVLPLCITSILATLVSSLTFVTSVISLYAEFVVLTVQKSYMFISLMQFSVKAFPVRHGTFIYALINGLFGAFALTQYGLFRWYNSYPGAAAHVKTLMTVLSVVSLIHPIVVFLTAKGIIPWSTFYRTAMQSKVKEYEIK